MSSLRPHQTWGPFYTSPKHAMTSSVNYAPFAPCHLYEAEDPLQSYVRSRPIEKVKDPRPILSQTGSPIMPGGTPSMSVRAQMKHRFRPMSTLPILQSSTSSYSPHYDSGINYSPTFSLSSAQKFTYVQPASQVTTYAPVSQASPILYPYDNSHLNK